MRRILLVLLFLLPLLAMARLKEVPNKDIEGARDLPFLKRYEGSYIVDYEQKAFDRLSIPTSPLKKVEDKNEGGSYSALDKAIAAEGRYTRILYLLPEGRTPLEAIRNYVEEIRAAGGTALFSCKNEGCGGDVQGTFHGHDKPQSLLATLFPPEKIQGSTGEPSYCVSATRMDEQRYVAFTVPTDSGKAKVAVLSYALDAGASCEALDSRTVVMVLAIEPKAREQKMVTVSADEMAQSLASTGRIALYGVHFDTNKTEIKPDSVPALEQIAALLKADPALKVFIVGHTDNVGSAAANLDLSKRRANAVVASLVNQYGAKAAQMEAAGVGMLSPIASNDQEAGRAKNRRVELVKK